MNGGLWAAAEGNHIDLIEYFINLGADDMNRGLVGADAAGNKDLVEYFINLGADDFGKALVSASAFGHFDLVKYFLTKNLNHDPTSRMSNKPGSDLKISLAISQAKLGGYDDIVDYLENYSTQ